MLSGKIPIKPLETGSTKQIKEYNIPQILQYKYENKLLLETEFGFIKRQQSSSAAENTQ